MFYTTRTAHGSVKCAASKNVGCADSFSISLRCAQDKRRAVKVLQKSVDRPTTHAVCKQWLIEITDTSSDAGIYVFTGSSLHNHSDWYTARRRILENNIFQTSISDRAESVYFIQSTSCCLQIWLDWRWSVTDLQVTRRLQASPTSRIARKCFPDLVSWWNEPSTRRTWRTRWLNAVHLGQYVVVSCRLFFLDFMCRMKARRCLASRLYTLPFILFIPSLLHHSTKGMGRAESSPNGMWVHSEVIKNIL